MGRIKKAAGPKHEVTLSPALADFVTIATTLPLSRLPAHLKSFSTRWPFPRGDLYHWIPVLDRFDNILEQFNREYGLHEGPQTRPFACLLLEKGVTEARNGAFCAGTSQEELEVIGFGPEGDRELIETILVFSKMLVENCGNRSLYSSSERLGDILNTTSLSLLLEALRLAVRLAQRYHASRQRGANPGQHLNTALLASHYNIDLEKVQKIANPFVKSAISSSPEQDSTPLTTPGTKGKDKTISGAAHSNLSSTLQATDLYLMAEDDGLGVNGFAEKVDNITKEHVSGWEDWGSISLSYYRAPSVAGTGKKSTYQAGPIVSEPSTPTPARRTSGLSRPSRLSGSDDSNNNAVPGLIVKTDEPTAGGMITIEIPFSTTPSTALEDVLEMNLASLPKDIHYELLARLRAAYALSQSLSTRRQIVAIRILAITNLAYVYPDTLFEQKILKPDSDEPRRLQLAYQLADLIHRPGSSVSIPTELKTVALGALEALIKQKKRAPEVCAALSISVNHGILLYVLRQTIIELGVEDSEDENVDGDEWRDALFSLLEALSSAPRTADALVAAGLFDILIEVLTLRTKKAERNHPKVLMFLNSIIYTVKDAFQNLANSKGLDIISELTAWEVQTSLEHSNAGDGLPERYRNQVMDYQVPYFQQQTLRWIFKFVNHMMAHGNTNFDRLLRNLVDSPQLLSGLRMVIVNGKMFGSNVWSGAVNILSSFINNEPTSYAVIAEAGLSKGLLEGITLKTIGVPGLSTLNGGSQQVEESAPSGTSISTTQISLDGQNNANRLVKIIRSEKKRLAEGILPATDAIVTIPQAFGAICLNTSGLNLFLDSGALDSFFEIFESPDHIKSMTSEMDLPRILGNSFDELVRHHPRLKPAVMGSVVIMIARVESLCRCRAWEKGVGAKLWAENDDGELEISGGKQSLLGELGKLPPMNGIGEDVAMDEAPSLPTAENDTLRTFKVGQIDDKEEDKNESGVSTYINVAVKFLAGFFENNVLCANFIEAGGVEFILDLATLPSLPYDFNNHVASQEIARVVHMLVEQKPHLVLPALIQRTQKAVDVLEPLMNHASGSAFFSRFTNVEAAIFNESDEKETSECTINGTAMIKALVAVHTLSNILYETFSPPIFNPRATHSVFSQVNLADMYVTLVDSLGRLHRACVWEEILLQKSIPESWIENTRTKGYGMGSDEADEVFGFIDRGDGVTPRTPSAQRPENTANPLELSPSRIQTADIARTGSSKNRSSKKDQDKAQFKNIQSLRHLLSQIPSAITPFFQGLGKALTTKRRPETYPRQNAYMVADALAKATLEQLQFEAPRVALSARDRYAYWIVILTSISQLMIEGPLERPHSQCLTLVLQTFKNQGGLKAIEEILQTFFEEVKSFSSVPKQDTATYDGAGRLASAYGGIKIVLTFYTQITTSKYIVDSNQTNAISSHDRDREQPYYFSPAQFLVELRMTVLPVARSIWDSEFVDKASSSILKCLIEILRTVLDGEHEQGAFKRSEKVPARSKPQFRIFTISKDRESVLLGKGYDKDLVQEALYRCSNNKDPAEEYCKIHCDLPRQPRIPIPEYDREKDKSPTPTRTPQRQDSQGTISDATHAEVAIMVPQLSSNEQSLVIPDAHVEIQQTNNDDSVSDTMLPPPPPAPGVPPPVDGVGEDGNVMAMSIDNLLNITDLLNNAVPNLGPSEHLASGDTSTSVIKNSGTGVVKPPDAVTVEDLDNERAAVRRNLIDRALDVLNVHDDVTFELADLITTASAKSMDVATMRKEIGETLVQSLISFQMDEDFRPAGKKIAAYANLLALVLQEKEFYDATLDELKNNFALLLRYVRISPEQTLEETSPWIGQILLVVEKLLAEDVQPQQIRWTPPNADELLAESIVEVEEPLLHVDEKFQLFETIIELLPRIGKDESLALSVVRILVILTRDRDIATKLAEKRNMQRLFVMVKQLSGITNEKLQSSFMLVLRHIIEDDETIRQIMRSEIVANFETRSTRPTDTTGYVRHMYHLVLRSPKLFVEVTNEKLKLQKFDRDQHPQILSLRADPENVQLDDPLKSTESQEGDRVKSSTDELDLSVVDKSKHADVKAPVVERPDGVIHYLLCELLSYKDVDDKDPSPQAKELSKEGTPSTPSDIEMANSSSSGSNTPASLILAENGDSKKGDRPDFKAEQYPIYIYRCFLLQCLTELLSSYNRTKVEFINFSRKADPKAMTPSKPRSGVLNYLLNAVIPVGTLNHEESTVFRKKSNTSKWGMSVIVSLCLRTGEKRNRKKHDLSEEEDQEPDLLFVRKFVLEHALKAFKDANSSSEPLDMKYARLLCIADLFHRMLAGRLPQHSSVQVNDISMTSQKELAKIMFEKNFISALTSSIADIDLNFPESKRAVKHILQPLKQLTQTAIILSETSSITSIPGNTDDDEISTATSVSDMDDEREETPDLFRNSTLGMFEPGRDEESSSESSDGDEDMYDDPYDDEEMEYGEEIDRDGDEVVSDEDEEIDGAGHLEGLPGDVGMDVEVVIDGEDDEPSDDDDPDDSEDMDNGEEIEIIDEMNGDHENESLADGDEEEWQDDDDEGEEEYGGGDGIRHDMDHDHESDVREIVREFENAGTAIQGIDTGDLVMDIENGTYMDDVVRDDEDADNDEEDQMDDEDVMYEPDYEDDEPGIPDPPWGWDPDDESTMPMPRGHHHSRRMPSPWTIFPPGTERAMIVPTYRSHRPSGVPRGADDGTNPLLQRARANGAPLGHMRNTRPGLTDAAASMSDWVHAMDPTNHPGGPVSFVNNIISAIGQGSPGFGMGGPHGALHFHIAGNSHNGPLPREIQAVLGLRRPNPEASRTSRDDPMHSTTFIPTSTTTRWQEEARLLFGNTYVEKTQRVVNSLLRILVPPAIEEEKIRKGIEADALKKAREEREKELEEERVAKEKAEKEAQEKKEQEEREAAERAAAASAVQCSEEHSHSEGEDQGGAMEGLESNEVEPNMISSVGVDETAQAIREPLAEPSESAERVRIAIRGREVDITNLGIDLEYLEALPEELREEVLVQQLAEQRSQAAATGEEPTDISREFLEALPPEIRDELIQQEAQDRRRREREENRRRAAASGGPASSRAEEMDPASFLASLDPNLRQAVLMEQDEEVLAQLPQAIAAEARALGSERLLHRWGGDIPRLNRTRGLDRDGRVPEHIARKPQRRQIVQMLDKAGVATLLRLMFVPQHGTSRQTLNEILHNVSQNRQNRAEVVSLLLSILQDGSADVNAVERSFAHLSLRAKQPGWQKTPQHLKRILTGQLTPATNSEITPLMVAQQCLSTLVYLTELNPHIPSYFLTEHEASSGFKAKSNKKGKGKETRASRYALNALLSLLDRKLIMDSSSCMEQLSSLLQSITHPLTMLLKKEKDKPARQAQEEHSVDDNARPSATVEAGVDHGAAQALHDDAHPEDTIMAETSTTIASPQADSPILESGVVGMATDVSTALRSNADELKNIEQEDKTKKSRKLTPPVVPEHNLRLVVNILAARECSGKTFRDTVSTINNLSAIPEAKEIFGKELIKQAQDLAKAIPHDLDDLTPQIQNAKTSTDIQGMALAKFSPSSSDQAKLLRVLTALDYLFDQKRNGGRVEPIIDGISQDEEKNMTKDDLLTRLYESSTFGPLWAKLSECLSAIRPDMMDIALILLPLIEALMLVCKNTTLKDALIAKLTKEFSVTSPPPESRMENLFFRFTEDHRKVLNFLVRRNPKLMSGTFALLVENPKVLEFDNKRNYFTRRLHSRGSEARHPQPPLQVSVSRDQVFRDSFRSLHLKSSDEMKYGKLSIRFQGEEGVDAGGVTREWFQVLSRQMFDPNYALFKPVASDRTTFHPNKLSHINEEHLMFFNFIGRIIGKALYEGRALDCHFSRAVYKRILGKPVSIKDMETLDLDYYKSLLWMLENDITDIITETFSIETEDFGETQIVDLIENGRNVPVTEENKQEYVQLVVESRLTGSVKVQLEEFLRGFHDVVPAGLISIFDEQELELLISGLPDIDVDDWKNNTEYHNYSASSAQIQWFWRAVRSFDKEERAKLLQFVTGTSKVPLNGFKELEGMNGFSRFNIHRDYGNKDRLPSSHTCFNQLDIPEYDNYEALRQRVYTAMTAGSEYFGFA